MTVMPTPDAQLSRHWAFVVQWREGTTLTPEAWPTPAEPVPVGFATGLPIGWNSSTGPTSGQCLNYVNFGLDSVSTAVETASAATSSSSGTCSLVTDGRGPAATAALHNAFVAENAAGEAFYALGAQGHAEACTPFTSKMVQGATEAVPICNHLVAALSGATNPDLRACGDSAVPPVPPLYAAGEHHFILPHEVAPMGAAEVIAFEEVRAKQTMGHPAPAAPCTL